MFADATLPELAPHPTIPHLDRATPRAQRHRCRPMLALVPTRCRGVFTKSARAIVDTYAARYRKTAALATLRSKSLLKTHVKESVLQPHITSPRSPQVRQRSDDIPRNFGTLKVVSTLHTKVRIPLRLDLRCQTHERRNLENVGKSPRTRTTLRLREPSVSVR